MKRQWFCVVGVGLLAATLASAQQPGNDSSNTLKFENGTIANGVYSNECFGFSFQIPAGWEVNDAVTAGGKARHRSDKSLVLLFLHQQGKLPGRIILSALDSAGHIGGPQEFVTIAVRAQINSPTEKRELVRYTFAVDYGGRRFFRSDYKAPMSDNTSLYFAYVYTEFRGYFIGETLAAASPEELDEAANSLRAVSFQQNEINPTCAMGDAVSPAVPKIAIPQRVRVSSGVAVGLLIKKIQPQYPFEAEQAGVQGQVVLLAEIDKNGNVENLTLVSGHPMLAPAAIEAVKQWKYKPYLLNAEPVNVETQVIVNFSLSRF
ncbi:MAG: energy transducer TonB [Terriglobales bacterium]